MKIDCSITENYLKEKSRITGDCATKLCSECLLSCDNNGTGALCDDFERMYPDRAVAIVQRWSDEHPMKTYKDDFLEKFPNAPKNKNGFPITAPCDLYMKFRNNNFYSCSCIDSCDNCWDKVMEES